MENTITPLKTYTIETTKKLVSSQVVSNLFIIGGFLLSVLIACSLDKPSPLSMCCTACWSNFVTHRNTEADGEHDFINSDDVEAMTTNLIN